MAILSQVVDQVILVWLVLQKCVLQKCIAFSSSPRTKSDILAKVQNFNIANLGTNKHHFFPFWRITSLDFLFALVIYSAWENYFPTLNSYKSKFRSGIGTTKATFTKGLGLFDCGLRKSSLGHYLSFSLFSNIEFLPFFPYKSALSPLTCLPILISILLGTNQTNCSINFLVSLSTKVFVCLWYKLAYKSSYKKINFKLKCKGKHPISLV